MFTESLKESVIVNPSFFLVEIDFSLQLGNESLHTLIVHLLFILLVGKLLDLALSLSQVLLRISNVSVFSIKLRFQLPDAIVHLVINFFSPFRAGLLKFSSALTSSSKTSFLNISCHSFFFSSHFSEI